MVTGQNKKIKRGPALEITHKDVKAKTLANAMEMVLVSAIQLVV